MSFIISSQSLKLIIEITYFFSQAYRINFWPQKNQKLLPLYIVRDFPGNRNLSSLNDLNSLKNLSDLNDLNSLFSSKNLGNLMIPSTQAPKWPILVSQCGMDHQKSTILLISGTVSVGGCGGQECYNKPSPRVISQMLSSWKHAESNKKMSNSS